MACLSVQIKREKRKQLRLALARRTVHSAAETDTDVAKVLAFYEKEKKNKPKTMKQTEVFLQNGTRRWGEREGEKEISLWNLKVLFKYSNV